MIAAPGPRAPAPTRGTAVWREVTVRHHLRDDGASVSHVGLEGGGTNGWDWIGFGPLPQRAPLVDPRGRERRFRTPYAAKSAVDRVWPAAGSPGLDR